MPDYYITKMWVLMKDGEVITSLSHMCTPEERQALAEKLDCKEDSNWVEVKHHEAYCIHWDADDVESTIKDALDLDDESSLDRKITTDIFNDIWGVFQEANVNDGMEALRWLISDYFKNNPKVLDAITK